MSKISQNSTHRLPNWLASKFIDETYLEEFFGDLEEIFEERIDAKGRLYAQIMYWVDVLHLVKGFHSISIFKTQNHNTIMIKNMFKIAWRNALRQKQFSILNILGLTIGIIACLFIGLYVHSELSYDNFHSNGDRIYRINQPSIWNDWDTPSSSTGPNVAVALRADAPEFEQVTRIQNIGAQYLKYENNHGDMNSFKEERYYVAENNFFDVFSFKFLQGNAITALDNPLEMVMTQETAERYFGHEDAMGKTVEVKHWDGTWKTYTVVGVLADTPNNSHIQFDMLVSLKSYQKSMDAHGWKWIWTGFSTYGMVHKGTDIAALEEKIQSIPAKWAAPTTEKIFNQSFEEFTAGKPWTLYLQPLREIYSSGVPSFHRFGPTGNSLFVKIFGAIGILIFILSSINFMNLSTAKSANRAKEVGIRKVLGSERKSLMLQFIFESIAFVTVATMSALVIVRLVISWFNNIADKELALEPHFSNPIFWLVIIGFIVFLGIISGSYPAFYLSSFKPIETLKGNGSTGFKGKGIRNTLVVFQFTISIALIICAFFVQKQLSYTSDLDMGMNKENILQIHNIEQFGFDTKLIKATLESNPAFSQVGKSFGTPPRVYTGDRYKAFGPDNPVVQINNLRTEGDYMELLGVEFVAGRNFEKTNTSDKYTVILNESAVKALGWGITDDYKKDSPIGKFVAMASGDEAKFEVIGVVKDFNFTTVRDRIEPLILINHLNDNVWDYGAGLSFYSLKLNPELVKSSDDLKLIIENVKNTLREIDDAIPFEYSFMDEQFDSTFESEQKMGVILSIFTSMALAIACLGLFGLAAFSAEQRNKELGIRKVLGANVAQLVLLFSSEFTKLVLIAILISAPLAYYLIDYWLNNFAYRTPINVWVFALATSTALLIALITISYQALKTAYRNPVESLKDE